MFGFLVFDGFCCLNSSALRSRTPGYGSHLQPAAPDRMPQLVFFSIILGRNWIDENMTGSKT